MAPWIDDYLQANGTDIHYLRTGGGGPPVILLHGLTDNGACWTRLARDLAADYDLIMPDARGHGRSSAPAQGYRAEDRAADVLGLIDALALDRPVLIGHSMGGLTAAMVAVDAPARIRGALLEDPAFISAEGWQTRAHADWVAQHQAGLTLSEEMLVAQGRAANPGWSPDTFGPWARAKRETSVRAFDWFHQPRTDAHDLISRLGVATLLVTGDPARGAIVTPATAAELQALSSYLRVAHIPNAGHCIRYEQPEQFATVAGAFLAERCAS